MKRLAHVILLVVGLFVATVVGMLVTKSRSGSCATGPSWTERRSSCSSGGRRARCTVASTRRSRAARGREESGNPRRDAGGAGDLAGSRPAREPDAAEDGEQQEPAGDDR